MSHNAADGKRLPGSFPRLKRPDLGFNHLLPSSSDVHNERSYSSSPLYPYIPSWRGRGKLYFYLIDILISIVTSALSLSSMSVVMHVWLHIYISGSYTLLTLKH